MDASFGDVSFVKSYKAIAPKITNIRSGTSNKIVFQVSDITHLIPAADSRYA